MNKKSLLVMILVFFTLIFTINANFTPTNLEINVTLNNNLLILDENVTITLNNYDLNWTNYSYANITFNSSNLNLRTNNQLINFSLSPYNTTYQNITWNLTAINSSISNITILLKHINGTNYLSTNIIQIENVSDFNITLTNTPYQTDILNGTNFEIILNKNFTNLISNITINYDNLTLKNLSNFDQYNLENPTFNFQAIKNNITSIQINITDKLGKTHLKNQTIVVYTDTCPSSYTLNYKCGLFSSQKNLNECAYESFTQGSENNYYLYYNNTYSFSFVYFFKYQTKLHLGSPVRLYEINTSNYLDGNSYNVTTRVNNSNKICYFTQIHSFVNPLPDYTYEVLYNLTSNRTCSDFKIRLTDISNSNFSSVNNVSITGSSHGVNSTLPIINTSSHNTSIIEFTDVSCSEPDFADNVKFTYNNSINFTKNLNYYTPSCNYINVTTDLVDIDFTQEYGNESGKYWQGFANYSLVYNDKEQNTNINSTNQNLLKEISQIEINAYNNESKEYTYNLTARFYREDNTYCEINNITINKTEVADPNILYNISYNGESEFDNYNETTIYNLKYTETDISISIEPKNLGYGTASSLSVSIYKNDDINPICTTLNFLNIGVSSNPDKDLCSFSLIPGTSNTIKTVSKYNFGEGNFNSSTIDFNLKESNFTLNVASLSGGDGGSGGGGGITITRDEVEEDNTEPSGNSDSSNSNNKNSNNNKKELQINTTNPNSENITTNLTKLNNFISKSIKHTQTYEIKDNKTIIKDTYKNINIISLKEIIPTVTIPKQIVPNTDHIQGDFYILEYDPIIQFYLQQLNTAQEITLNYTINRTLTQEQISTITTNITSKYSEEDLAELERLAELTADNVDIKIDVLKQADGSSKIKTTIDPQDNNLQDTKVYLEIPKCLAEHINEIDFERDDYEVIEEDPVVAWDFKEIDKPLNLDFSVLKEVDEDCWNQILLLPIAKNIEKQLIKKENFSYFSKIILLIITLLIISPIISKYSDSIINNNKVKSKNIFKKMGIGFEEFILILLIIFNTLDFFEVMSTDWDLVEKLTSWIFIGALVYSLNLSKLFFGEKDSKHDAFLIISYFALMISEILTTLNVVLQENLHEQFKAKYFLNEIIKNYNVINDYTFYIGLLMLISLALIRFTKEVQRGSMMDIFHEVGLPSGFFNYITRFISILFLYIAFFIVFFKFFIEWIGVAVDAVIIVVAITLYLINFIKKYKSQNKENLIHDINNAGEDFLTNFISLFKDPKKIYYGLSGMLVLHLLVDLGNFIIPYIVSLQDSLYFLQLAGNDILQNHTPIYPLLKSILPFGDNILIAKIIALYSLNFIAIIFCLTIPVVIWYDLYNNKRMLPHPILNALFFSSLIAYLKIPLFAITPILGKTIVGVDVALLNIFDVSTNFNETLIIAGIAFLVVLIFSLSKLLNHMFLVISIILSQLFFVYYVYSYVYSWNQFFIGSISDLWLSNNYIIAITLGIFFTIIVMFYISGFIANLYIIFINYWISDKTKYDEHLKQKIVISKKFDKKISDFIDKVGSVAKARPVLIKRGIKEDILDYEIKKIETKHEQIKFIPIIVSEKVDKQVFDYLNTLNSIYLARTKLLEKGWDKDMVDKYIDTFLKYF